MSNVSGVRPFDVGALAPPIDPPGVESEGATAAAQVTILRVGARGDEARGVQQTLADLGFLDGPVDGIFGRGTERAVVAFQRHAGLVPDGIVGPRTLAALDAIAGSGSVEPRSSFGEALARGGNAYLNQTMDAHNRSIDETGVGVRYGDHSSYKSLSTNERQRWLLENQKPGAAAPTPKESSCIGWAMENVKAAYQAAGKSARWDEIAGIVRAKGMKGTELAKELQKDGWEAVYFNPDAKKPDDGNAEHSYTARITAQGKPYYGIDVSHRVTDYRPTAGGPTTKDLAGFEKLKEVPFFFGLAKGGMHTFVGQQGRVNEFHWTAMPNDKNAIEERPLTEFPWNSGVIMVPPGTWP